MYSQFQLEPPSTYPFDVSRLSTGSALTAAHFCQTATKVSKKALPYHTAASPGLGGALTPALLWAFASSEQSHYKSKSKSNTNLGPIHVANCIPLDHPFALPLTSHLHSTSPVVCMGSDLRTGWALTGRNRPIAAPRKEQLYTVWCLF